MSVSLSFEYDCGWETLVTHAFGEWTMVRTVVVHFVGKLGKRNAVLAFLVRFVLPLALAFHFYKEMLETFVFADDLVAVGSCTVGAFLAWRMIT